RFDGDGQRALQAPLGAVAGVAVDRQGQVYATDPPAAKTSKVSLTIGGVEASVTFAGLAPGMTGVYQVRAIVPDGVPPGGAVALTLTSHSQTSAPLTAAFR